MKNILLFTAVLTALVTLAVGFDYNCDSEVDCSNCPSVANCKKTIRCGCCNICVEFLKENADCISSFFTVMQSPAECASGLVCNPYSKKCTSDHGFLKHLTSITCQGNICQCSYQGKLLSEYDYLQTSELTPYSCNCAVQKAKYRKLMLIGKMLLCTSNGSFENVQCTGSICFCVDENGIQLSTIDTFRISDFKNNYC